MWQCLLLTPYAGLGYDNVNSHILKTDLNMRYRNYYGILGGRTDIPLWDGFSIGFDGQWQLQLDSSARLSSFSNIRYKLENKNGYLIELPLCYRLCNDTFILTIAPFTRRYKDGKSKTIRFNEDIRVRLPEQVNQNWGGKVNIGVLF
jgi:hypothetical protein